MPNFEHRCVSCDHFYRTFGTFICDVKNEVVAYPFQEGRFCQDFKKRCKDGRKCTCNDDTKTG